MVSLPSFATKFATQLFGSSNERKIKTYSSRVEQINALEPELIKLTDDELRMRSADFREQIKNGASVHDILVPAFATVREAAKRALGQRHYDVQLIGGMVLNDGRIAEMKTGEGKTLVGTLPVYLNALTGKGVHVVTVNDYLAKRDAAWMSKVYNFLGLSVGCILPNLDNNTRRKEYACDITYGTNNEFGFDYLRDNMEHSLGDMVQRGHYFAIVDEVDSILVDEARTPLIISGAAEDQTELYKTIDSFIPGLQPEHYEQDEKQRTINLTEAGNEYLEDRLAEAGYLNGFSLYDAENVTLVHHINQALKAHKMFAKDRDYIVKKIKHPSTGQMVDSVVIIDEFTGRMMEGRRYSEGLHQALEAKENVPIQRESQTLASTTFQNYFRLYEKLAGMTGTATTEAEEFMDIYKLEVIEVPTHVPVARIDHHDEVYRTAREKYNAIIELITECQKKGQPVLVGTTSIEKSEFLSTFLKEKKITHQVLNAKQHEREAYIVAQAGVPGAVTIATNMAGRGTDIQLGGNLEMRIEHELGDMPEGQERDKKIIALKEDIAKKKEEALKAGGLYVIATERHESRRIDNQLRGRSGRQGDPGASKFFLSLEDELMRIFGSERMDSMLQRLGLAEGEAITHPWINKALEKAQQKVEARNFDIRKNLLKFDNVMNDQRKVIFEQRIEIMSHEDVKDIVADMRHEVIEAMISQHIPAQAYAEQWNAKELQQDVLEIFGLDLPVEDWAREEGIAEQEIEDRLKREVDSHAARKAVEYTPDVMRQVEKISLLETLDTLWREHLLTLEHLRQVIHWRSYAQVDPLNEYKREAFSLFETLLSKLREDVTKRIMHTEVSFYDDRPQMPELPEMQAYHPSLDSSNLFGEIDLSPASAEKATPIRNRSVNGAINPSDPSTWGKVGRNDMCPCGSGKKYKHCHGQLG